MLYKKIHRQYLREYKRVWNEDRGLYSKPYINTSTISIMRNEGKFRLHWDLICTKGSFKGRIRIISGPRLEWNMDWRDDEDKNNVGRLRCYIRKFIDNTLENLR